MDSKKKKKRQRLFCFWNPFSVRLGVQRVIVALIVSEKPNYEWANIPKTRREIASRARPAYRIARYKIVPVSVLATCITTQDVRSPAARAVFAVQRKW
jgi:hypothetical protein